MRSLLRCSVVALVCAIGAFAQSYDRYTVAYSVTLAGATTAFAVQLPSTGVHQTEIVEFGLQCTADCSLRFENNGNAATGSNATAATVTAYNPETTPAA